MEDIPVRGNLRYTDGADVRARHRSGDHLSRRAPSRLATTLPLLQLPTSPYVTTNHQAVKLIPQCLCSRHPSPGIQIADGRSIQMSESLSQSPMSESTSESMWEIEFPKLCWRVSCTPLTEHKAMHSYMLEIYPDWIFCGYCGVRLRAQDFDDLIARHAVVKALPRVAEAPPHLQRRRRRPPPSPLPGHASLDSEQVQPLEIKIERFDRRKPAWLICNPREERREVPERWRFDLQYLPNIWIKAFMVEGHSLEPEPTNDMSDVVVTRHLGNWFLKSSPDGNLPVHKWLWSSVGTVFPLPPDPQNDLANLAFGSGWPSRIVRHAAVGHRTKDVWGPYTSYTTMVELLGDTQFSYDRLQRCHVVYVLYYKPDDPRPSRKRVRVG